MNRCITLILVLALGLQSILASTAAAHGIEQRVTQAHCAEMGDSMQETHERAPPSHGDHCPCCPDMAFGCIAHCVLGACGSTDSLALAIDLNNDYASILQPALLDRFDTPPTPPPIG